MKRTIIALTVMASFTASATDLQTQIDELRSGLHDVHMNTLQKYSESWGLEDRANIAKLQETKVDVTTQAATDDAQNKHINAVQDAAQTANDRATALESRADTTEQNLGNVQEAAQIANERATNLELRADATEAKVDTKVNQTTYDTDQARQDQALADSVMKQAATDAKQTTDLKSYADKKATSAYTTSVAHTDAKVARADADRKAGDDALSALIDTESADRVDADSKLSARIDTKVDNTMFQQRAEQLDYAINQNKAEQQKANQVIANHTAQLANHEQRLSSLETSTNQRFSDMDKRINENKRQANAGIASVAAMASIPQVTEYQSFAIGAGAGNRSGEQAIAVGFSARVSSSIVTKVNVAADTQNGYTIGAGISYGW